jgi:tRNA splicing ligase
LNNFLTVRLIFTSNTPIDSANHGEQIETFEIFQNSNLGEQGSNFFRKLPFRMSFEPFHRLPHVIHRSIKQTKRNKLKHSKFFKIPI